MNKISGTSMEPNLKNGTNVITRRYFFTEKNPGRGDIIIYKKGGTDTSFVGRVIALPKELIRFNNGNLYIDNKVEKYKVEESYLREGIRTYTNTEDGNTAEWIMIGEVNFFVLPDQRNKRFEIKDQLVNKNNIESVVILPLK